MADHLPRMQRAANYLAAYVFSRLFCRDLHRRVRTGDHGHEGTALVAGLERDLAFAKGKQGMVLAHADAFARIELGAALANDHVAAGDLLAAEQLDAQHFRIRVATVARRTACLFVCHTTSPLTGSDAQHLHRGEVLAVA